ncbi:MAG: hypothetical protein J3Q66DRAFT_397814 [Benniella sp.]|nr:MAG: hypothetical protein J3Q66DRAFT_397814 [Benniella sp.]
MKEHLLLKHLWELLELLHPPDHGPDRSVQYIKEFLLVFGPEKRVPPESVITLLISIVKALTAAAVLVFDPVLRKIGGSAYVTLSPLAIFCGYVAVAVNDRDLKPLVMLAGQVLSEALNAMKRVIKQARPTVHDLLCNLLLYRRDVAMDDIIPPVVSAIVIIWSALVIYSRVHLYYHTWLQVVAGTLCGIAFAVGYYYAVYNILRPSGIFE